MIPIVTPAQMAAIDAAAPEPVEELIERAGAATARVAFDMLGGAYGRVVTVVAGRGNNGADGRAAAVHLERRGILVETIDVASCPRVLPAADLVIDAAFGTGFRGEWDAPTVVARERAGLAGRPPVLAVDIPSGVNALTGEVPGTALYADRTVTFQALKPGLVVGDGRALAGEVTVADIGLDVSDADAFLVEESDVARWWPSRPADAHKWHGAVRVVAGSIGMPGAARLCVAGAARAGAGLVKLSAPGAEPHARSEVVQEPVPAAGFAGPVLADLDRFGALAIGPGLGRADTTIDGVRTLIAEAAVPVVVDGDGLFAAAWSSDGAAPLLRSRALPTVLTPHDGEFAVLTGAPPGADRIAAARGLAEESGCTVLLKGPTTVVATAGRPTLVVDHGDQRLATAGTGDVLTGIVAALLAAGLPPDHAAAAGAWVHADAAVRGTERGLLAGDLVDLLPEVLSSMTVPT